MLASFAHGRALHTMRRLISPCQSVMQRGGLDHVDSCFGATSMRLESVSVRVLTRDFHHGVRHHEAVMASAVGTTVRDHEKFLVFLRFMFTPFRPALYGYMILGHVQAVVGASNVESRSSDCLYS